MVAVVVVLPVMAAPGADADHALPDAEVDRDVVEGDLEIVEHSLQVAVEPVVAVQLDPHVDLPVAAGELELVNGAPAVVIAVVVVQ